MIIFVSICQCYGGQATFQTFFKFPSSESPSPLHLHQICVATSQKLRLSSFQLSLEICEAVTFTSAKDNVIGCFHFVNKATF